MLAIIMDPARVYVRGETVTIAAKAFGDPWAKEQFGAGWLTARVAGKISRKANTSETLYYIKFERDRAQKRCRREDLLPGPWCAAYFSTSSWGGTSVYDPGTKLWLGFFSEFLGGAVVS